MQPILLLAYILNSGVKDRHGYNWLPNQIQDCFSTNLVTCLYLIELESKRIRYVIDLSVNLLAPSRARYVAMHHNWCARQLLGFSLRQTPPDATQSSPHNPHSLCNTQVSGRPRFHSTNKVERFKSMQGGLGAILTLLIPSKPLCSSQPLTFSWIFSKLEELLFNFGLRSAHYIHLWLDGAWHYSSPPWQAVV